MTRTLKRLKKDFQRPLVECGINGNDRRGRDAALTNAGRLAVERYRKAILSSISPVLSRFRNADCKRLLEVVRHLEKALSRQ
jgi:hypothetical protein